jgi:hypothetical protein
MSPIPNGASRDARFSRDFAVVQALLDKGEHATDLFDRTHARDHGEWVSRGSLPERMNALQAHSFGTPSTQFCARAIGSLGTLDWAEGRAP